MDDHLQEAIQVVDDFFPSLSSRKLVPTAEVIDFCLDIRVALQKLGDRELVNC